MIIHIRHPRGLNHALLQSPGCGPVILSSWSTEGPRAPTARSLTPEEAAEVVRVWRALHKTGGVEVVAVDTPALMALAPFEGAPA